MLVLPGLAETRPVESSKGTYWSFTIYIKIDLLGFCLWALLKDDAELWLEKQTVLGPRKCFCKVSGLGHKSPDCVHSRVASWSEQ